jgi:heterodisulfide reductase subunit C
MLALYTFNIADIKLAELSGQELPGVFPISSALHNLFGSSPATLAILAQVGWWVHIVGIFTFLNYLPISKHFHIILAFPNTYFSKLEPKGKLDNVDSITHEIRIMLDPSYQIPETTGEPLRFGAKDVTDLSWKTLMDAYTCTECGRCSAVCPANITGKKLSPRKIIMDTRDRMEELKHAGITNAADAKKYAEEKGTSLLGDYISAEELWACTTCNACTEACPVNIDHVSEILDLRRYIVLEESAAPQSLNAMFTNMENNGAPWAMSSSMRFDWANNITMPATV